VVGDVQDEGIVVAGFRAGLVVQERREHADAGVAEARDVTCTQVTYLTRNSRASLSSSL